jgi:hypothetical protein
MHVLPQIVSMMRLTPAVHLRLILPRERVVRLLHHPPLLPRPRAGPLAGQTVRPHWALASHGPGPASGSITSSWNFCFFIPPNNAKAHVMMCTPPSSACCMGHEHPIHPGFDQFARSHTPCFSHRSQPPPVPLVPF